MSGLWSDANFAMALGVSALASCVLASVVLRGRRWRRSCPAFAGVAAAASAAIVLGSRLEVPDGLLAGLVLLGAAGALVDHDVAPPLAGALLAAPGAWLIAWHGDLVPVDWIRSSVGVVIVIGGWAFATFDRRWARDGAGPVCFAVTAMGAYFTVPDPYEAIVLFGAAVPVAFLGWPRALMRFGGVGCFPSVGLLAWAVARGGFGRQSSIVGGLACLGLVVLEPVHRRLHRGDTSWLDRFRERRVRLAVLCGSHLAFVAVASRVAGLQSPAPYLAGGTFWRGAVQPALLIVAAAAVTALVTMEVLRPRVGRGRRERWLPPPAG